MEPIVIGIFIVASLALGVLMTVEIIEYRRYRRAAHSVIALGESMQIAFDQVAAHLNSQSAQTGAMAKGVMEMEQDIILLKTLVQVHGEILKMKGLNKTFDISDSIKRVWDSDGTEERPTEIQGT